MHVFHDYHESESWFRCITWTIPWEHIQKIVKKTKFGKYHAVELYFVVQNGRSWSMTHKPWFMVKNEPSIGIVMAENGVSIKMNGPETKADCTKVHRTRWKWTVVFDMNWTFLFMTAHFDRLCLNMSNRNLLAHQSWPMAFANKYHVVLWGTLVNSETICYHYLIR